VKLPKNLDEFAWELPRNFLGLDADKSNFDNARVVILPVPYEATVSFGAGTGNGPDAIIEASRYIELYDQELDVEPYEVGIATLPSLELTGAGPAEAVRAGATHLVVGRPILEAHDPTGTLNQFLGAIT